MRVKKRDGSLEPVDLNKILRVVEGCAQGLSQVDPMRVTTRTVGGLYDGATTQELDRLSIEVAASLMFEEPEYSRLAARLLARFVGEEVVNQEVLCFSDSVEQAAANGLINEQTLELVRAHAKELNEAVQPSRDGLFEYFGLRTLYDRYLLKHPSRRKVLETPQYFFMRVAVGVSDTPQEAIALYELFSSLEYLTSSPTLFNSGTHRPQLSSCFLLDSPQDDLRSIYNKYTDVAMLSKFAGGIGLAYHRVRSRGSHIKGTNGESNGVVPFLKTLDSSVAAVNQGGRRKGACSVYLEAWHADIEAFLELRDNTGDEARRTHNLNLANWIPDLFMRRVEEDGVWSLFDPCEVPELPDLYGAAFENAYLAAEKAGLFKKQVKARDLYGRMMRTLAETGNGWMCFKDASNEKCNQVGEPGNHVHLSNLCTEILEVNSDGETSVCNLGSINLARHVGVNGAGRPFVDYAKLANTVRVAVQQLDRVIDRNLYPIDSAQRSNLRWRPIGLGVMGLQDVFFKLKLAFDSPEALRVSRRIAEEIYYHALATSCELAQTKGAHPSFPETRTAKGQLQFDLWGEKPEEPERFEVLREKIRTVGLRNSLLIAIAPTATIASIAGCYECIEPQVSNLFKRETLSGEFLQVNRYLVEDLRQRGLWTAEVRDKLKSAEGSVQSVPEIPEDLKHLYRTAWELPMRPVIDLAAARGPFIDQSQSLNLFAESPNIGRLSSMYFYAWKKGLKTTYYLRSRPATRIAKTTVRGSKPNAAAVGPSAAAPQAAPASSAGAAVACSLENPEYCEACQ